MQRILFLFSCAVMALGLGPQARAQAVQLSDGRTVLATVVEADGEGLRIRRLDNGGMLDLRWDHLSAASAHRYKREFDLVGDSQDELLVRAEEVQYLSNGTRQSVIGRIEDRGADPLVVQARGVRYPIQRRNLQGVRAVEVPATQVYTKDEYYRLRLVDVEPGDSADKHMLLAEDLIKFRDYDNAQVHLDKAKELGNTKNEGHLDTLLDRLKRYKAAAKELGILEQIQAERSRGKLRNFEKGVELIEQFETQYPNSKLKTEFEREKKRFGQARMRYLTQRVADQWRRSIQSVAEKSVGSDAPPLATVKEYAENKMTEDIIARLQKLLHLEPEEIRQMWDNRTAYPVGKRTEHFNYGIGSWVLGEKAVLKDTKAGKTQDKLAAAESESSAQSREIEKFAKLLRKAMENRRSASSGGGQAKEQTEEGWWKEASRAERISWLRAYYAEFGGELVVKYASASKCISCYGEGSTPEMGNDGKMTRSKCFLCQGTKWQRSFKAY